MDSTKEISKRINGLIEKNNDAHKGYIKAAENADSHQLKAFLNDQANQRKTFNGKLSADLRAYNPSFDIDTDGSTTGSLHRTWMDVKAALSMDDDESLLEECIRGDKASAEEYEEFLNKHSTLHTNIKSTVQNQLQEIRSTLSKVKRLEDLH